MWVNPSKYQAIGESLTVARQEAGLTQQQLAKRLRKPQSFISAYERGQRRIDVMEFLKVVEAIGAEPREVFADVIQRNAGGRAPGRIRRGTSR